ncbi:MAG: reverse transcriptase (domains: peptidase, RT, RNase H) [Plant associated caulimovirus 1]|nr:MAG: reverse transcriptase (domains: peptidase, RT, RNase H) [Plant associated caulimovirus 1]
MERLLSNITNPNSTYIKVQLKFQGYRQYHLHGYIDTGASICVANQYVIPSYKWEDAKNRISVQIANTDVIELRKVAHNITVLIAGEEFFIPTIYQQNTGVDFLIGNNFLHLYAPFVQWVDRIALHKDGQQVLIQKVTKAYSFASPELLPTYAKPRKRGEVIPRKNITAERENGPNEHISLLHKQNPYLRIHKLRIISNELLLIHNSLSKFDRINCEKALKRVSSDNPLDKTINKALDNPRVHARIELLDNSKVIRVKPMNYTPWDRTEFKVQIKELLDLKVIRPSSSPHSSPAFMVENEAERRRGKKRMVVNYKELNKHTIDDGYFLPKKEELFSMIKGMKWFSTFDCKSGFWQVPLAEECRKLTAFSCPNGQYEWNVVAFGLKQAPGLFQRRIDNALRLKDSNHPLSKCCTVYVDDILIFSKSEEEHYVHVIKLLEQCLQEGIILSEKKAQLAQTKIKFLGLTVENGSISMQDHILTKITEFPSRIKDKTQLQRFLGLITYAEGFVPKLAEAKKPLQGKLKKDVSFAWTEEDSKVVDKIKKKFTNVPPLYHPLETDASGDYWGAALKAKVKESDGDYTEKLCRYTSGTFKKHELSYHSNEKECLAVKKGIKKFRVYLISSEFLVRCDNKNFGYFLRTNIADDYKQGRLVRWQQWFSHYKFKVEHIKGTNNVLADCLTREFHEKEES